MSQCNHGSRSFLSDRAETFAKAVVVLRCSSLRTEQKRIDRERRDSK